MILIAHYFSFALKVLYLGGLCKYIMRVLFIMVVCIDCCIIFEY